MSAVVLLRYLWAAPATAVGLLAAGAWLLCGARACVRRGALEVSGGRLAAVVERCPDGFAFCAITLGHVILGTRADVLDRVRSHEQAHVRQYERWGVLFFPAYAVASLVAWLCARHPYWNNHFEHQARREAGEEEEGAAAGQGRRSVVRGRRPAAAHVPDAAARAPRPRSRQAPRPDH